MIDWGLAKDLDANDSFDSANRPLRAPRKSRPAMETASSTLTVAGSVMGTPAYMAPEQARGETVDQRADVFALGAMLYHVLAGSPPYNARTATDVIAAGGARQDRPASRSRETRAARPRRDPRSRDGALAVRAVSERRRARRRAAPVPDRQPRRGASLHAISAGRAVRQEAPRRGHDRDHRRRRLRGRRYARGQSRRRRARSCRVRESDRDHAQVRRRAADRLHVHPRPDPADRDRSVGPDGRARRGGEALLRSAIEDSRRHARRRRAPDGRGDRADRSRRACFGQARSGARDLGRGSREADRADRRWQARWHLPATDDDRKARLRVGADLSGARYDREGAPVLRAGAGRVRGSRKGRPEVARHHARRGAQSRRARRSAAARRQDRPGVRRVHRSQGVARSRGEPGQRQLERRGDGAVGEPSEARADLSGARRFAARDRRVQARGQAARIAAGVVAGECRGPEEPDRCRRAYRAARGLARR